MDFNFGYELVKICDENKITISQAMLNREIKKIGSTEKEILEKMKISLDIMRKSTTEPIHNPKKSMGGLVGGESSKLNKLREEGKSICGSLISKALMYSLAVLEVNTSMGVIVAAPTAGSSGVIPAVLLALQEEYNLSDEKVLKGLLNASAVGYIIMKNASVSGAEAGCQAEIGSACAMASSAVVEIMGGSPKQCLDAAAIALANILGLVCDPVAGLVEVPCQSRNGMGVSNAFVCAEMVLSGIESVIPFDEMVSAMYEVGTSLPDRYRETALGGCASTPTGCQKFKEIFK